jgi:hypothetical protein
MAVFGYWNFEFSEAVGTVGGSRKIKLHVLLREGSWEIWKKK